VSEVCNHKALAKRDFLLTNTVNVPFIIVTSLTPVITLWKLKPTAGFQRGRQLGWSNCQGDHPTGTVKFPLTFARLFPALLNPCTHAVFQQCYAYIRCLQCFEAVGWAAGRACGL